MILLLPTGPSQISWSFNLHPQPRAASPSGSAAMAFRRGGAVLGYVAHSAAVVASVAPPFFGGSVWCIPHFWVVCPILGGVLSFSMRVISNGR